MLCSLASPCNDIAYLDLLTQKTPVNTKIDNQIVFPTDA